MKEKTTDEGSRRRFLTLGLLGGAGLVTQKVEAIAPGLVEDEKVPMLTADGKLVEVSKKILEQSERREKAKNEDILKWSNSQIKT